MTVLRRESVQSRSASPGSTEPVACLVRRSSEPCLVSSAVSAVRPSFVLAPSVGYAAIGSRRAAHRKPASSRATATATLGVGLCSATNRRKRRHSRCCALSAIAITRAACPSRRRFNVSPTPGRC